MARPFSNVLLVIFWTENDTEDNFFEPEKIERNIWEERQYVISIFNMFVWKQDISWKEALSSVKDIISKYLEIGEYSYILKRKERENALF